MGCISFLITEQVFPCHQSAAQKKVTNSPVIYINLPITFNFSLTERCSGPLKLLITAYEMEVVSWCPAVLDDKPELE